MSKWKNIGKRNVWETSIDVFMMSMNAFFVFLISCASLNGIVRFEQANVIGKGFLLSMPVIAIVAASRLFLIEKTKIKMEYRVITAILYTVSLVLVTPFMLFFLILETFHDKKINDPNKYKKDMYYGELCSIAPEKIPTNAQNVEFYYETSNVAEYHETFLQYSLPPQEYSEIKDKVLLKNQSGTQSKFFENSYDIDVGNKDRDDSSPYSYDFVSFCDEEYVVRLISARSRVSVEPYFKAIASKSN